MSKELEKALELPEGWLIELGFDVLDRPFRFVDSKSHLPTIKVVLPACEVDESSAWDLRDSVASLIGKLLASQQAEHPEQAEGAQGERETARKALSPENQRVVPVQPLLAEPHPLAALAQPSPAPELERPIAVAYRSSESGNLYEEHYGLKDPEPLMTVAQHDRIRAQDAAQIDAAAALLSFTRGKLVKLKSERDAAQDRVVELERQEPFATVHKLPGIDYNTLEFHSDLQAATPGQRLYSAPVAQAGQVPEEWRAALQRLEDACDKRSALFSAEAYRVAIQTPGFGDAMSDLDDAREAARDLLAAASAQGGDA
ncbi:hypothetical protein [Pseudomonas nitroreducens]|uniref:hypothetical protein n=1 Tax=Pseudomonas nitroreducens TaxID=46680 RepID=UPI0028B117B7|nr:hypothetical protein [Pseudomonas nitroreducens]